MVVVFNNIIFSYERRPDKLVIYKEFFQLLSGKFTIRKLSCSYRNCSSKQCSNCINLSMVSFSFGFPLLLHILYCRSLFPCRQIFLFILFYGIHPSFSSLLRFPSIIYLLCFPPSFYTVVFSDFHPSFYSTV